MSRLWCFRFDKDSQHFQFAHRIKERRNQWLDRDQGPVACTGVTPALKIVCARRNNAEYLMGFILRKIAEAKGCLFLGGITPIQVRRAIVKWIAAKVDNTIDLAQVILEIGQITVHDIIRRQENNRLAVVPQCVVNLVNQLVHCLWLTVSCHQQALALVLLQIIDATA